MSSKSKYAAQFWWLTSDFCNLDCIYCANTLINNKAEIPTIDIDKLQFSLKALNKTCRFVFTGGEPFLVPNFVETCAALCKEHYLFVISNFTSNKVKEFADKIAPEKVTILGSLHIKELERTKLLDRFIENYFYLQAKGFKVTLQAVAYPELLPEVVHYKKFFSDKGITFDFVPYSGFCNNKEYPKAYKISEKRIFGIKRVFLMRYKRKPGLCNAGYNSFVISPNGNINNCFKLMKKCGHIYDQLPAFRELIKCKHSVCECCTSIIDKPLFKLAVEEIGKKSFSSNESD